jgi:GTP cyclohydrolase II
MAHETPPDGDDGTTDGRRQSGRPIPSASAPTVRLAASCRLPTEWGVFDLHGFEETPSGREHVALTLGDVSDGAPVLARLHSECLTGDALSSLRCDCGPQLDTALAAIAAEGRGMLLYLRQEGRGIGLLNKIRAYRLQDEGADTVEANLRLGLAPDLRKYDIAAEMLVQLGVRSLRLMTNNPRKIEALEKAGITVVERVPLQIEPNPHNAGYLRTKRLRLGHLLASGRIATEETTP